MIQIGWAGIGVIVAILVHAGASIWWASKITAQIGNLNDNLLRMDKELAKRDDQISAAWKKIDDINNRITVIETRYGDYVTNNHKKKGD